MAAAFAAISISFFSSASFTESDASSIPESPSSYYSASTAAFLAAFELDDNMSSGVPKSDAVSLIIFETPSPAEVSPVESVSLKLAI